MVKIAKGLKQTFLNAIEVKTEDISALLTSRTNCYEVLNETYNRCNLDIDGKFKGLPLTEQEFNEINTKTESALKDYFHSDNVVIMTSSSYAYLKVSFRVVYPNIVMTKKQNKLFAKECVKNCVLPKGVSFDTGIYTKNRKMRMLGSCKDGENRPLIKVGEFDTLLSVLSIIPLDAERKEDDAEDPKEVVEVETKSDSTLSKILPHIAESRLDEYDSWIKIGLICKSAKEPLDTWETASRRSPKYKYGECGIKWKTFKEGGSANLSEIWTWLEEDCPEKYEEYKHLDYKVQKCEFEKEVFCLNNPACFARIKDGNIQLLSLSEMYHIYSDQLNFFNQWREDTHRLTYERLDMLPRMEVPVGIYNTFNGYEIESQSMQSETHETINELFRNICNFDEKVVEYVLDWFAHLIQKPSEKPRTSLVFQGKQGDGKDTPLDYVIAKILGMKYYLSTGDALNDIFGSFNAHLREKLLVKIEEADFMTNKTKAGQLKNLITCPNIEIRDKGVKASNVRSCMRIIMTTNNEVPVLLEDTNRRFVLIQSSSKYRKDTAFWKNVYATIPKELYAFYTFLNTRDISKFEPTEFPMTAYHAEVKQSFIPFIARFFQRTIQANEEQPIFEFSSHELLTAINAEKYDLTAIQLGKHLKDYIRENESDVKIPITKKRNNAGFKYKFLQHTMIEFLKSKEWWVDF